MNSTAEKMDILLENINLSYTDDVPEQSLATKIPPGYALHHIILIAILVSVIMVIIVFGNLLVVVAIATDRQLKSIQNWFIASLAVADLLLGLVIMPFSLANELMRYWYFGSVWCDLWKAIDVFLCTASILSICLISLDRYWSITRAIQYSRQRTSTRTALMITAVWVLSGIVCVPPLIGWKNPLPTSEYPLCLLSSEIGYVISSCMGSFYIPAVIMVFVYFKIYQAAKERARRVRRNKSSIIMKDQDSNRSSQRKKSKREDQHVSNNKTRKRLSSDEDDISSKYKNNDKHGNNFDENESLISKSKTDNDRVYVARQSITFVPQQTDKCGHEVIMEQKCLLLTPESTDTPENSTSHDSKTNSSDCTKGSTLSNSIDEKPKTKVDSTVQCPEIGSKNSISEITDLGQIERQKKKLAKARERRATIVLGLVMAAFIVCWFPFFTIYIVTSLCGNCIPDIIFTVAFWAGYCNSALNPIIYTIFNQDFRKAFRKIIFRSIFLQRNTY